MILEQGYVNTEHTENTDALSDGQRDGINRSILMSARNGTIVEVEDYTDAADNYLRSICAAWETAECMDWIAFYGSEEGKEWEIHLSHDPFHFLPGENEGSIED